MSAYAHRTGGERRGLRRADAALAVLLMAIVGMMIVPLPTALLDLLIATNIALSLVMLLVALVIPDGLAFTAMPTVLLVTTLYRLALNVSSTRLILLQADAGQVIRSFGDFVVRGDYVVGGVVFLILTLIQYVVVARGAERVAEVGARFTLDAMPGKQMAIDADLRAGTSSPDEARARRGALERESQFYGAMDGAMKFVKGDAIAGIAITLINVVAGVGIGVGMRDMSPTQSLQLYGLLTIGDGLVSQIPSLLISTSAGLVVTRVASAEGGLSLGSDVAEQLFGDARVLALGAGFLVFLAVVPGLPALPFAVLSALLGAGAFALHRRGATPEGGRQVGAGAGGATPALSPIGIDLGRALAARLDTREGPLEGALDALAASLFRSLGMTLPAAVVTRSPELPDDGFELRILEVPLAEGSCSPDDAAAAAGHIAERLGALVRCHAGDLWGLPETQAMLAALERTQPALVRHLVPGQVPLERLSEVLRRLVAEGVSVRPLRQILEALARAGGEADPAALTEEVRAALSRQLTHQHAPGGLLHAHPVDAMVEDLLRDAVREGAGGGYLALSPEDNTAVIEAVRRALDGAPEAAVLLTQADVRPLMRQVLQPELPGLAVLSYAELSPEAEVEHGRKVRIGG